ncbi:uncharacterized protein LOC118765122 isoform X1 [Octopus sinensis]|uniref:Uncharacterized protein LOC118765122 isoform X1 n=2 Tax=Octopus sinensis TaxID=2607531 RepID=A0A7E6F6F4_9MOLL|nr:uncharacterized protein LOC118765122 isoform X1 [Octopus sinensis]
MHAPDKRTYYSDKLKAGHMQKVAKTTLRINMNIGVILLFYLLGFLRCEAYNPHDRSKDSGKTVEETAKKTSGLLTTILTSLVSNKAQPKIDPDTHYLRIIEGNMNNFFPGKLKPTRNNWFQILPTPVVTNDVSLKTVVGCVIASLGERLIKQIESEAHHHGRQKARLQWAKQRLSEFIQFLQRAICTFELVDKNKNSYINHSEYTTFMTVIQDYLLAGKYLYKLAVSAYRQVADDFQDRESQFSLSCNQNNKHHNCSSDVIGILKQLQCFSNCRETNNCRNKITKLRKMLRRAKHMIINSTFRLKHE